MAERLRSLGRAREMARRFALFCRQASTIIAWTTGKRAIAQRDAWPSRMDGPVPSDRCTNAAVHVLRSGQSVRDACHARSIEIMGDLPIFVAHDSADVWAHRELFRLDADGRPTVVAGVPPDYFSATGQLWGNPHYRWDVLAQTGYAWWVDRFRAMAALVDSIRADFPRIRGVVGSAPRCDNGRTEWVKGPGAVISKRCNRR